MSYWSRLISVFRSDRVIREIDEELQSHVREALESGRDPAEVKRAFGSMLRLRESSSDVRLIAWLDCLRADTVFAFRRLRGSKVTTVAAILSLALAFGACIAAFRLIDALLLRPLPVKDPSRLFVLAWPHLDADGKKEIGYSFDYPQFRALRAALKDDAELVAISSPDRRALKFGFERHSEEYLQQFVSGWMFSAFGLKAAAGRLFTAADDATPSGSPVAVLSYDYWTRRFGRDPRAVGRTFKMGTDLYQITGVCQQGFTGTEPGTVTDIFLPTMMFGKKAIEKSSWQWFRIWIQLKPDVAPEVARQKVQSAAHAYREEQVKGWNSADAEKRTVHAGENLVPPRRRRHFGFARRIPERLARARRGWCYLCC